MSHGLTYAYYGGYLSFNAPPPPIEPKFIKNEMLMPTIHSHKTSGYHNKTVYICITEKQSLYAWGLLKSGVNKSDQYVVQEI